MTLTDADLQAITQPGRDLEPYLRAVLDERDLPGNLREAASYALLGPGKRLRPVLAVRCCEAVGGQAEQAYACAAAVEMIHCFSLVHDDLPAMDDDDLRRGRPTLHRHTNEAMAILAGDLLVGLAFEHLAKAAPAELSRRLCDELSMATNDMIAGQVYDTMPDFDESVTPEQRLDLIHHNKTGALIRCACRMGGISGGADDKALEAITDYAQAIGLMFQVVDDLLDITQSTEHLGKTAGKDVTQGKLTYPALLGVEASRHQVENLQAKALASLDQLDSLESAGDTLPLRQLCRYMAVRTK